MAADERDWTRFVGDLQRRELGCFVVPERDPAAGMVVRDEVPSGGFQSALPVIG
jgi:hypothetical protein